MVIYMGYGFDNSTTTYATSADGYWTVYDDEISRANREDKKKKEITTCQHKIKLSKVKE